MHQGDYKQTLALVEAIKESMPSDARNNIGFVHNSDKSKYASGLLAVPKGWQTLPIQNPTPWGTPARYGIVYDPSSALPYILFTRVLSVHDGGLGNAANGTLYVKRSKSYQYERVIEADTLETFTVQVIPKLQSKGLSFKAERERMDKIKRDTKNEKIRNWTVGIICVFAVLVLLGLMLSP